MLPGSKGIFFSKMTRALFATAVVIILTLITLPFPLIAVELKSNIICRDNVPAIHREQLANKLRKITGWTDLRFDEAGVLRGGGVASSGGSAKAREFVLGAMRGRAVVVIEDASKSPEVVFCRVNPARWKSEGETRPPAFVVQIDFADFEHVMGDEQALQAFDEGWALLHELDHVVNDSSDATAPGETGECEDRINQMRRECNLPQRASYYYTFSPLTADRVFKTRLVRLAFDQEQTRNKKKRYWVVWDANSVGGVNEQKEIASLR